MASKKQVGAGILALIAAVAGGGLAFDLSTTTTTTISDDDTNITNEGDVNINADDLLELCNELDLSDELQAACDLAGLLG